jgi:hypothetical protein
MQAFRQRAQRQGLGGRIRIVALVAAFVVVVSLGAVLLRQQGGTAHTNVASTPLPEEPLAGAATVAIASASHLVNETDSAIVVTFDVENAGAAPVGAAKVGRLGVTLRGPGGEELGTVFLSGPDGSGSSLASFEAIPPGAAGCWWAIFPELSADLVPPGSYVDLHLLVEGKDSTNITLELPADLEPMANRTHPPCR